MNNSEPILVGEFVHSVDTKGRVAVPSPFRKKLNLGPGDKLVLSRGLDQCVQAYTETGWSAHVDKLLAGQPLYDAESIRLKRRFLPQACEVELDNQGRVLLPRNLKDVSGIKDAAVIIGVGGFFELWEPGRYRQYSSDADATFDQDLIGLNRRQARGDIPSAGDGR